MNSDLPIEITKIEKGLLKDYLGFIRGRGKKYILKNEILNMFSGFCSAKGVPSEEKNGLFLYKFLKKVQEMILFPDGRRSGGEDFIMIYRRKLAHSTVYRLNSETAGFNKITIREYLNIRDSVITGRRPDEKLLAINFIPFYDYSPMIKDTAEIGNGISFLNKVMSNSLFHDPVKWNTLLFDFLRIHKMRGKQLLVNGNKIETPEKLAETVEYIMGDLAGEKLPEITKNMSELGLEPGWGNTPGRIRQTLGMLLDLINSPDAGRLESFTSRIPMISKIAVISPHGWFAQKGVLGLPDTGGQIIYILDQVKYLEKQLKKNIELAGLDIEPEIIVVTRLIPESAGTTCGLRLENIEGTQHCRILRVPFRNEDGSVHPRWISRFHIWPYLERFAQDSGKELAGELGGRPDLVIGNYSDGNLVATMLAKKFGVTQCGIAHALEKTKYIFSDLYWKDMENDYNFSLQFTADLISMNMASFVISSTLQEITGTEETTGQYENYQFFSMPELYHVTGGVNLLHPKFNVIPPGVREDIFFPHTEYTRRKPELRERISGILFSGKYDFVYGELAQPEKAPVLVFSRLDRIKNIGGLVLGWAENTQLRKAANLIIVAGGFDPEKARDAEEHSEILRIRALIEKHGLDGNIRWVGRTFNKEETGELYRAAADRKGVFVQPALFEGFGLTVIEAMASGLPVFATQFGGPSEIIKDGRNGFLINPTLTGEMSGKILRFIERCGKDHGTWEKISRAGIKNVKDNFNWNLYANRLLKLANLHGFWNFSVSTRAKEKMKLYCDVIYDDFIRKRLHG